MDRQTFEVPCIDVPARLHQAGAVVAQSGTGQKLLGATSGAGRTKVSSDVAISGRDRKFSKETQHEDFSKMCQF
jgi:hypothetical protein